jgi:hypothetical protein
MKRYSRVCAPDFLISSPAAAAEPPVAMRSLRGQRGHSGGEQRAQRYRGQRMMEWQTRGRREIAYPF